MGQFPSEWVGQFPLELVDQFRRITWVNFVGISIQPFPLTNNGRDKKVAAAIVVPTKAATSILPPGTSGILGINPLATSIDNGCTKNNDNKNDKSFESVLLRFLLYQYGDSNEIDPCNPTKLIH